MKLFKIEDGWNLRVSEEAWGLIPFANILKRDKSKNKEIALKEMLYVFYFTDIRSNYIALPLNERMEPIRREVGLPESWEHDEVIDKAVELYDSFSTPLESLYKQALNATQAIGKYLNKTESLLEERDKMGKPVNDINKIAGAVQKVPKLMQDLKSAYKELVKEKEDIENKKSGSKSFNTFEDGL